MTNPVNLLSIPLKNHLGYVNFILSNRNDQSSEAFTAKIPGKNESPIDLWYHGTNNLYRAAFHILNPELEFNSLNQPKPELLDNTELALSLYQDAVNLFIQNLNKLNLNDMEKEVRSPISGNDIRMDSWIGTNVMHTLGHISQALRLQGMLSQNLKIFNIQDVIRT